ncbi:hypothetical protein [Alteromonas antoniana]|uniref:hypothetical protein n=1 Tax=Alteromonas antoniana TaxID=2803813 RepID=UPI001C488CD6|nr:hypothetical protein [Alteromonas antoniana]
MLKLTKIAIAASAIVALSTHFTLANTSNYRLIAFEDCNVVSESILTPSQVDAYLALTASEQKMEALTQPVESLDADIDDYADKISELTHQAIQEDGDTLRINKKQLREQEALAQELEALMKNHEKQFEALEKEARVIETAANAFEKEIRPLIDDIDHDVVRIVGPDDAGDPYECDGDSTMILM